VAVYPTGPRAHHSRASGLASMELGLEHVVLPVALLAADLILGLHAGAPFWLMLVFMPLAMVVGIVVAVAADRLADATSP
jgi:hypothetical protein